MPVKSFHAFLIAFFGALWGPIIFSKLPLFYFTPYLAICLYRFSRIAAMWRAFLCGMILDFLSSYSLFGLTSINYCCVSFLLYGQTTNFFEDKISTLPIMTFLYSALSTLFLVIGAFFLEREYPLSWTWVVTDLIGMSVADALYALFVFSLPIRILSRIRKGIIIKD